MITFKGESHFFGVNITLNIFFSQWITMYLSKLVKTDSNRVPFFAIFSLLCTTQLKILLQ